MFIYIDRTAELMGQIKAIIRDDYCRVLGCTKLEDIPKEANEDEIKEMKKRALNIALCMLKEVIFKP